MPDNVFHFGLTGWPIEHSLSPALHQAALDGLGFAGSYELFPIPPGQEGQLVALVSRLRAGELHGLNVTLPYKTAVIPLVDQFTETAAAVGAVNTIFLQNGQVVGDNTDVAGFLCDLKSHFPALFAEDSQSKMESPIALVLGAGGAARAVVYALLGAGWQVVVAARRVEQAEGLVKSIEPSTNDDHEYTNGLQADKCPNSSIRGRLSAISLSTLGTNIYPERPNPPAPFPEVDAKERRLRPTGKGEKTSSCLDSPSFSLPELKERASGRGKDGAGGWMGVGPISLIVNATSAGMAPNIDQNPWPEEIQLPHAAVVYDLVYRPQETALVRMARRQGLEAMTGGGMLVEQAALSFERWTGQVPPRKEMQQALVKELNIR